MSPVQTVIDYMTSLKGVVGVMKMTDEMSEAVNDIEKSIKTQSKHEYVNVGYDMAMKKKHRICVFFTENFLVKKASVLKMVTEDGTILGTTLSPEEIEEYKDKPNVIWVSEDFVMFTDIQGSGPESFVLYPYTIEELDEVVGKKLGAIGTPPTSSSDMYLKKCADVPLEKRIFTSVIAFDD